MPAAAVEMKDSEDTPVTDYDQFSLSLRGKPPQISEKEVPKKPVQTQSSSDMEATEFDFNDNDEGIGPDAVSEAACLSPN